VKNETEANVQSIQETAIDEWNKNGMPEYLKTRPSTPAETLKMG
jgi:hypothetical protein